MDGFLSRKIKTVSSRSMGDVILLALGVLFFFIAGAVILIFAAGTGIEEIEDRNTALAGYAASVGAFTIGILLGILCVFRLRGRLRKLKEEDGDSSSGTAVNVFGTDMSLAAAAKRFDQEYEKGGIEIRAELEPSGTYLTDTYLVFIYNDIQILDLRSVLWVSFAESLLSRRNAGLYGFDFYTKQKPGGRAYGKKSPMSLTLTNTNLARQLYEALKKYPFAIGSDDDLEELYTGNYSRFEQECLKRMKK